MVFLQCVQCVLCGFLVVFSVLFSHESSGLLSGFSIDSNRNSFGFFNSFLSGFSHLLANGFQIDCGMFFVFFRARDVVFVIFADFSHTRARGWI